MGTVRITDRCEVGQDACMICRERARLLGVMRDQCDALFMREATSTAFADAVREIERAPFSPKPGDTFTYSGQPMIVVSFENGTLTLRPIKMRTERCVVTFR